MDKSSKIAIIFFSLSGEKQANSKKLIASNSDRNRSINKSLIVETHQVLKKSRLPIFHFDQDKQKGLSFGEKLANAYEEVFDLGYEAVISVGNDSPEISKINWTEIIARLQKKESILGPNLRGGSYLIGINKSLFDKKSFAELPWQRHNLFTELVNYCESNCISTTVLEKIRDINSFHDLKLYISNCKSFTSLYQLAKRLLNSEVFKYLKNELNFQSFLALPGAPFRAPPQASSY